MKKIATLFFIALLCCTALNAQVNRANTKKSVPYKAYYQRMASSISANHTLEIRDGTLWAWWSNLTGQLGDGTMVDKNSPVQIGVDSIWVSIAAVW